MKQLIVFLNGKKVPKFNNAVINTFEEEYNKYKLRNKKNWLTEEGFSLDFDSTLEDLKKSIFVYPNNIESEKWIKKYYKVIEENNI